MIIYNQGISKHRLFKSMAAQSKLLAKFSLCKKQKFSMRIRNVCFVAISVLTL